MTDRLQSMPVGADTWRSDRTRHVPNPSVHIIETPPIGFSGVPRVRLDAGSFYLPPDKRATKSNGVSHGGQDGSESGLPNGGSSHIAEAGFRAATPIRSDSFHEHEIPVFDGLTPAGIPGANIGGSE